MLAALHPSFLPFRRVDSLAARVRYALALALRAACFLVFMAAFSSPVRAALADELNEVTRLHHAGQSDAALKRADAYLADKPKDAQMRFLKAVVLSDLGRRDEAIGILERLTGDYPELAEPFNNLAALYAASGDYGKARVALEQALRANPDYATAQENLGDIYAMLASQSYAQAMRLEPESTSLPSKLALVRQLGKPVAPPSRALAPRAASTP